MPTSHPGVLIADLLSGDGPFVRLAEDFVALVCGDCRSEASSRLIAVDGRFLCGDCYSTRTGLVSIR